MENERNGGRGDGQRWRKGEVGMGSETGLGSVLFKGIHPSRNEILIKNEEKKLMPGRSVLFVQFLLNLNL